MKAMVYYGQRNVKVELRPDPTPFDTEVVVKVDYCGIADSDYAAYLSGVGYQPEIIIGHEVVGIVSKIGKEVPSDAISIGDRVTFSSIVPCMTCKECKRGQLSACLRPTHLGIDTDGGMSEYVAVPYYILKKIPSDLDPLLGVFYDSLAKALYAKKSLDLQSNATVVMINGSSVGLFLALLLLQNEVEFIFFDRNEVRRKIAAECGVMHNFDPLSDNIFTTVYEIANQGADILITDPFSLGNFKINDLVNMIKLGGQIIVLPGFNIVDMTHSISINQFVRRNIALIGIWNTTYSDLDAKVIFDFTKEFNTQLTRLIRQKIEFPYFDQKLFEKGFPFIGDIDKCVVVFK